MEIALTAAVSVGVGLLLGFLISLIVRWLSGGEARLRAELDKAGIELEAARHSMTETAKSLAAEQAKLEAKDTLEAELRARVDATSASLNASNEQVAQLRADAARLAEALHQERQQAEEKLALLQTAKEQVTQSFASLAGAAFKEQSEALVTRNKEQVESILSPLNTRIAEFRQGLENAQAENVKERATLQEQIRALSEASGRMTMETTNLTRALKGDSQRQGAWGEMILESILEHSGLREGEEYVAQETTVADDGTRVRPDIVVSLPGNQRVVIDSKLSLTAYEEFCRAESDDQKSECLERHAASIRTHIRSLGKKDYPTAAKSDLDYVIMFIPIESALAAALSIDADLATLAHKSNVSIGTPTTLMMALRTIASVWQVERRNRNAEEIATRAGRLYDKFVGFVADLETIGSRLNAAQSAYDDARSKLTTGRGNLVRQVEALKEKGARTQKALPSTLIEEPDLFPYSEPFETAEQGSTEDYPTENELDFQAEEQEER